MSLINDALKRARHEALRQEEGGRRVDYRTVPAHSRRGDRHRLLLVGGWCVAAVALALVAWLWLGPSADGDEATVGPAAPAGVVPDQRPEERASPESEADGTIPDGVPMAGADAVEEGGVPGPTTTDPSAPATSMASAPERTASSPAPPAVEGPSESRSEAELERRIVAESRPDTRLEEGATYLRRVRTTDGSVAELGGIAYSDTRPIAVINGAVVSNGDFIAGFTVVAVEPERVVLEADGVRIYLSLH